MLMYLCSNTNPEIAFAVNQCACHSHHPMRIHGEYLKHIGRYLKATCDKVLIFKPDLDKGIECYADADFAGLWSHEDKQDPHCI